MISLNTFMDDQNQRERQFFNGRAAMLWTALPGIVQSFDAEAMTCEVQPAIQGKQRDEDGSIKLVNLPLLLDCPVVFPHAGGCSMTFPIKPGDECLVVFACRAIDLWWQSGGVQPPAETRMHDLSDGFVIPGPYSQPKVISAVSTDYVELRSDDRQAYLAIHPSTHEVRLETTGNVIATVGGTTSATLSGAVTIDCGSTLTATVSGATKLTCPTLTVDCPQTTFTGAVTVQGLLTGTGGFSISGGSGATAQVSGDISLLGSMEATGDVTASGISLNSHVHIEQGDGQKTSGPQ